MATRYPLKKCPVCGNTKGFKCDIYSEEMGMVENHTYCPRCGYVEEMAYSALVKGHESDTKRGHKTTKWVWDHIETTYEAKNTRKRKRIRRKLGIKLTNQSRYLSLI